MLLLLTLVDLKKKKPGLISRKTKRSKEVEKEVTFATGAAVDGC